jgi:exopolysaccharide biosynthesis polyprenyl glycosylphosphotransferase
MVLTLAIFEGGTLLAALGALMLSWPPTPNGHGDLAHMLCAAATLVVCALVSLYYADAYNLRVVPSVGRFAARLPRCLALASVLLAASWALLSVAAASAISTLVLMLALLPCVRAVFYRVLRSRVFSERVLIIGAGPLAHMVVDAVEAEPSGRYRIVGLADDGTGVGEAFPQYPVLGPLEDLDRVIDAVRPDRVVVALQERRGRLRVNPLLEARLRDIEVEEGAELYERLTGKLAIESLTPASLIFCRDFRRHPATEAVAHAISVATALAALIVLAPLLGLIALAIRLDSDGPVFFVQERVGRRGKPFPLVKFRTMRDLPGDHSEWAADNGFRITRVGHWLRKFRLDELPQVVNILRGDMDLVGPRPHPMCNFSLFVTVLRNSPECGEQIPYYSLRSVVRPGMTGWAQVRYRYANNLEEEIEKMRYDLYYVKHRSLWLDLRILADTLKTVVMGHGAGEHDTSAERRDAWQLVIRPE